MGKLLTDKPKVAIKENLIASLGILMESPLTVERVSTADDLMIEGVLSLGNSLIVRDSLRLITL